MMGQAGRLTDICLPEEYLPAGYVYGSYLPADVCLTDDCLSEFSKESLLLNE